jgi:hypothetical protein
VLGVRPYTATATAIAMIARRHARNVRAGPGRAADRPGAGGAAAAGTGAPNPRIAGQLVVSLDTVKKHVSHLLGKLGAASRTEAVTRARQLGLIP